MLVNLFSIFIPQEQAKAEAKPEEKEAKAEEKKEEKAEEKKEEKAEETEEPKPPSPFVLFVDLHCVGCVKKIERSLLKIRGLSLCTLSLSVYAYEAHVLVL